jgi:hypothetical protein
VIVNRDEFAPVGGLATGRRHWWRFEWFTQVRENLADRPRLRDEGDQPDVTATVRALDLPQGIPVAPAEGSAFGAALLAKDRDLS